MVVPASCGVAGSVQERWYGFAGLSTGVEKPVDNRPCPVDNIVRDGPQRAMRLSEYIWSRQKDVDKAGIAHRLFTLWAGGSGLIVAAASGLCYSRPALWEEPREANVSTQGATPPASSWISRAHAHAGWPSYASAPPLEGEAPADRLWVGERQRAIRSTG